MIWVLAVAVILGPVAPTAVAWLCLRVVKSERREHARERDLLVNQMCALAGKPWQEAPAAIRVVPDVEPDETFYALPEQYSLT